MQDENNVRWNEQHFSPKLWSYFISPIKFHPFIFLSLRKDKKTNIEEVQTEEPDINMALATDDIPEISEEAPALDELLNEELEPVEVKPSVEQEENNNETNDIEIKENIQDEKNRSSIEEVLKAMNEDLERQKYETIDKYEE